MRDSGVPRFLLDGKDPDCVALDFLEGNLTYGQLAARVGTVARTLLDTGVRPGDRVVLIDDNSAFWVAGYLGTMAAGCVSVPLPPAVGADEFASILESTGAGVVLAAPAPSKRLADHLGGLRLLREAALGPPAEASLAPIPDPDPGSLAALMFTSGSTGLPRGVMVSHRNIVANTESIIASLGLTAGDRMMTVLPFHYCFGTSLLHTHLRVGGSLVVDRRFMYPEAVLARMAETACTGFAGVGSHFQILLRSSSLAASSFPDLRHVQQAGGRLPVSDVEALSRALPETRVFLMYGQTEATARLSCLDPESVAIRPGSVGKAIPGVELRVVDQQGRDVPPGVPGEIVARGESVTAGYWKDPEATSSTFRDGTLHTGDIATVDDEGFLYIVDRAADFLKVRGERIACRQIEALLEGFDEVLEAAVVGIEAPLLGEAVCAFVVPAPGSLETGFEDRLLDFCRRRQPPHLVPARIVVLPELPRSVVGKLDRAALRALDRVSEAEG